MTLIKSSIPKLQHPNHDESETNRNSKQASSSVITTSTPELNTPTRTPWYNKRYICSDDEEDDFDEVNNESHDKTPSPKKSQVLEHQFDFASTPLNPNSTVSFVSPMNKLNALHLESQIASSSDIENDVQIQDHDDDDDEYDEFSLGNKTITNHSDDEEEEEEDDEEEDMINQFTPQYISSRKRSLLESPDMMMLTPNQNSHISASSNCNFNKLSIYHNSSNNTTTNTSGSGFKFSFSNITDSTPCPRQPKRKKLKFKRQNSQDSSRNILDLNFAKKTILSEPLTIPSYNEEPNDEIDNDDDSSSKSAQSSKLESTPISQSTPASLRASTPPLPSLQQPTRKNQEHEEYGEIINGYKFVKPKILPQFKYETPMNNSRYHQLRDTYNSNNYQIIGELPITSAGIMDENPEDEDIHIGDRRINDPYLTIPSIKQSFDQLRQLYFNEVRLPLLPPYFYQLNELSTQTIMLLITSENLLKFYQSILLENEELLDLLKQERIKWHPDKWVGKFKDVQSSNEYPFNLQVVDLISQTINGLIESL